MAAKGRDRFCARFDATILDLEQMTIGEVEAVLVSDKKPCVRAKIDARGHVVLKSDTWRDARRMIATIGAGVGLLAIDRAALASQKPPEGSISGKIDTFGWGARVTAAAADGKIYRAKVKSNGRYEIKHVPPGRYALRVTSTCGDISDWDAGSAVVVAGERSVKDASDPTDCIIVGLLEVERHDG